MPESASFFFFASFAAQARVDLMYSTSAAGLVPYLLPVRGGVRRESSVVQMIPSLCRYGATVCLVGPVKRVARSSATLWWGLAKRGLWVCMHTSLLLALIVSRQKPSTLAEGYPKTATR